LTPRTAVVVLGMHRSGTSALTGALHALGVPLGAPLLPPNFANERGYWELAGAVAIDDGVLLRLGASAMEVDDLPEGWDESPLADEAARLLVDILRRNFENEPIWAIKDPRICVLLPLWKRVFRDLGIAPRYLVTLRSPWEIAGSLESRDALPRVDAFAAFREHYAAGERETRGERRVFVRYEDLLARPESELERIAGSLGISWPRPVENVRGEIREFLEPSLRHWRTGDESGDPGLDAALRSFTESLDRFVEGDSPASRALLQLSDATLSTALSIRRPARTRSSPNMDSAPRPDAAPLSDSGFTLQWLAHEVPATTRTVLPIPISVSVRNSGGERWPDIRSTELARAGIPAVRLAYRFLSDDRPPSHDDYGTRVDLSNPVEPGESVELSFRVPAPRTPGTHRLQIDLVQEGVAWFESKGAPRLVVPINVEG